MVSSEIQIDNTLFIALITGDIYYMPTTILVILKKIVTIIQKLKSMMLYLLETYKLGINHQ